MYFNRPPSELPKTNQPKLEGFFMTKRSKLCLPFEITTFTNQVSSLSPFKQSAKEAVHAIDRTKTNREAVPATDKTKIRSSSRGSGRTTYVEICKGIEELVSRSMWTMFLLGFEGKA